jgi:hypothetical protein
MKRRINFLAVAALGLLVVGCRMPSGVGPARDLLGEEGQEPAAEALAPGSLSVEMDEARGQAVYINEHGARFDISASEYPGGPLVRCVQVESFVEIPPSDDPEALAAKAIVAGVRDDGTLGAWEIHSDDSIHVTVGEDGQARCLTGSDPAAILDGMQTRYGWLYEIVGSARAMDGRTMIIVGLARHPKGFTYGSVEVLPDSPVAVYWKVWRLPFGRFCIISPPRVIGNYAEPDPVSAPNVDPRIAEILTRLRQFFFGRLKSYLVDLDRGNPVAWDEQGKAYVVNGKDQDWRLAVARIDLSGGIVITSIEPPPSPPQEQLPDLGISVLSVSAIRAGAALPEGSTLWLNDLLTITAQVQNIGSGQAAEITVRLAIEGGTLTQTIPLLDPGASASAIFGPIEVQSVAGDLSGTTGDVREFQRTLTVGIEGLEYEGEGAAPNEAELLLSVGTANLQLVALPEVVGIRLQGEVGVAVKNTGTGEAGELDSLQVSVTSLEGASVASHTFSLAGLPPDPEKEHSLAFVPDLGSGIWSLSAELGSQTTAATLKVFYDRIVIDSYPVLAPTVQEDGVLVFPPGFLVVELLNQNFELKLSSDGLVSGPNFVFASYNTIDYKPTDGLEPGVPWYVRIKAANAMNSGSYAIRLRAAPNSDGDTYLDYVGWHLDEISTIDAYEPDDDPAVDGITATLTLGGGLEEQRLSRFMAAGDTDWVEIVLP